MKKEKEQTLYSTLNTTTKETHTDVWVETVSLKPFLASKKVKPIWALIICGHIWEIELAFSLSRRKKQYYKQV